VIAVLTEAPVRLITFVPHATQISQVLNVTLFGAFKRRPRYELPFEDAKATVKSIMNVSHDFKRTMVEFNIWGAFQAPEFEFELEFEKTRSHIDFYSTRKG
jgi:hypothetical protein